ENCGSMMGCSNPHPHCQMWATSSIPNEPAKEQASIDEYQRKNVRCLLCDYAEVEKKARVRVVCENDSFLAVVPFWAVWPFETLVLSRRHVGSIDRLDSNERSGLAELLQRLTA